MTPPAPPAPPTPSQPTTATPVVTSAVRQAGGKVLVKGTAEANAVVTITWPDSTTGLVNADATGAWSIISSSTAYLAGQSVSASATVSGASASTAATANITAEPVSKVPASGITANQCYQAGSDTLVSCSSAGAIALNDQQDGMLGINPLSYSKVGNYELTECVKDNVTGLIWEGKTADGSLRDGSKLFTNYDSTTAAQKYGSPYVNPTQAEIDATSNAVGYKNYVNGLALCGFTDWRLPTAEELQGIVDYSVASPDPTIRSTWFPNTQSSWYWSASPYAGGAYFAWVVRFDIGSVPESYRNSTFLVRLVRASQ